MKTNEYMEQTEQYVLHTYNRFPLVIDHGEGVHLYDTDGKAYLDFAAGIAVYALGYSNDDYKKAVKDQVDKVIHVSNLFYNVPMGSAAEKLAKASGMDKVFFTNSGTESIEGAIKVARKYAYLKDGSNDHEIIAMNHSFHGRSLGALSVTGNTHYQDPFKPLRDLCDEHDILLILDEIQCGMGRTGKLFAWQDYGVQPDVMTCAKALGCGVPVGAFVLNKKTAEHSLVPGDHGTTYGGNPLACAAVNAVFECYEKQHVVEHVAETAPYLEKKLDELVEKYDCLAARRGKGFMQGLVVTGRPVGEVINRAIENGLLVISAGSDVLRMVPPLVITKDDIDEMIEKLEKALQ